MPEGPSLDPRPELAAWLASCGFAAASAGQPLPGDVSPRRYERWVDANGSTAILALYPPELLPACARFALTTTLLAQAGVRVPCIRAADMARGWMLVEDLGSATVAELGAQRPWNELSAWFAAAARVARRIAALPPDFVAAINPPLDAPLMRRELAQTRDLFLVPQGLASAELDGALQRLVEALASDPSVPCHRDFMVRNLIPAGPAEVAVLDHQDLRLGPPAYDIASLLNDTLFPPPQLEDEILATALPGLENRRRYHRAAAQRTLKAVGTFAAAARRGSERHRMLIEPTLRRFREHFAHTPEGGEAVAALDQLGRWMGGG